MRVLEGLGPVREALRRDQRKAQPVPAAVAARTRAIFGAELSPEVAVERIVADVAKRGDAAVLDYAKRIDGWQGGAFEVPKAEWRAAWDTLEPELRKSLELAAERVRAFHALSLPRDWQDVDTGLGQVYRPIESVGFYVPGGNYLSTVLHTCVPARVAGVKTVVMVTPPTKEGKPNAAVLAAAHIAGVTRVFQLGGAQAVAALAYGTASIPKVDKIVGPGNLFVTLAKKRVFGQVGIDGLHGPTETLIIADDSAQAELCAADLLAQAEHDFMATPVLLTTSKKLAGAVQAELERQLATLERREVARVALEENGLIGVVSSIQEAIELCNLFAPEHACLMVDEPRQYMDLVRNAGGLFVGEASPEVLGDYDAGPSHVMPTGGTARFASGLTVMDFLRIMNVINLNKQDAQRLAVDAARMARAEGLTAHARAAELRQPKKASL